MVDFTKPKTFWGKRERREEMDWDMQAAKQTLDSEAACIATFALITNQNDLLLSIVFGVSLFL